mmetsp:Transcript_34907/g.89311  ORF Transcript_34907/g.89311 Transcript_34907/m.89311 type:complete len:267 (-) Transcript_34907:130-930(-)
MRYSDTAAVGHLLPRPQAGEALHCGAGIVQRVGSSQLLAKCIADARQLHYHTGRATSDNTTALCSRAQHNPSSSVPALHTVREGLSTRDGHLHSLCTCSGRCLLNSSDYLLCSGTADANGSLLISSDNHSAEAQLLATLNNLGHTADLDDTLLERVHLAVAASTTAATSTTATAATTAALSSKHSEPSGTLGRGGRGLGSQREAAKCSRGAREVQGSVGAAGDSGPASRGGAASRQHHGRGTESSGMGGKRHHVVSLGGRQQRRGT